MSRPLRLAPLALLALACSGEGNTGRPEPNIALWSDIPWANHGTPQFWEKADGSAGTPKISGSPTYPPIGANTADPGSREVDCSVLDDIEISTSWVDTFEPFAPGASTLGQPYWGVAAAWSAYDDGSDGSFRTPGDVSWYPDLGGGNYLDDGHPGMPPTPYARSPLAPWGMAADRHVGERPACDGLSNEWVLHFRGGRFNYFGGGMSHAFSPPLDTGIDEPQLAADQEGWLFKEGCPPGSDLCPDNPNLFVPREGEIAFKETNRPGYWDVSDYDGLVFWARRGPDGATSLLVGLQNKYTSDDLNSENEQFCQRIKVCKPNCVNGFECRDDGTQTDTTRCMPEGYPLPPDSAMNVALREFLFPPCGISTCKQPMFNPDPDFENTTCEAHSFTGLETGYWCTGTERPIPEPTERCGDGFVAPITLSTDWQFYKLPFDSFRQVGWGKQAPSFDLKTLYSIAFQFTVGYADVYVDNVSFYRNK